MAYPNWRPPGTPPTGCSPKEVVEAPVVLFFIIVVFNSFLFAVMKPLVLNKRTSVQRYWQSSGWAEERMREHRRKKSKSEVLFVYLARKLGSRVMAAVYNFVIRRCIEDVLREDWRKARSGCNRAPASIRLLPFGNGVQLSGTMCKATRTIPKASTRSMVSAIYTPQTDDFPTKTRRLPA